MAELGEEAAAERWFSLYKSRCDLAHKITIRPEWPSFHVVIPRFAALPYYKELQDDLEVFNIRLINSYKQHRYIADLQNYYQDIWDLTFKTWFRLEDVPKDGGPFVLKGETNSKKFDWNNRMYAETFQDASRVYNELSKDSMIGEQQIYVRQYVPLKRYMTGLHGLPITEEYRFFVCFGQIVDGSYYWASHSDDLKEVPPQHSVPRSFVQKVINRIGDKCNFYVIDISRTESDEWKVVELNDGTQSGLSLINADNFYKNLKKITDQYGQEYFPL